MKAGEFFAQMPVLNLLNQTGGKQTDWFCRKRNMEKESDRFTADWKITRQKRSQEENERWVFMLKKNRANFGLKSKSYSKLKFWMKKKIHNLLIDL